MREMERERGKRERGDRGRHRERKERETVCLRVSVISCKSDRSKRHIIV